MKNIWIFDDQFGESIYQWIHSEFIDYIFPIKRNIDSPLEYLSNIKDWDIILLDNFFPWEKWEEAEWDRFLIHLIDRWESPLWNDFINAISKKKRSIKILCISDYWEILLERFDWWNKAYRNWLIYWFIPSKSPNEIIDKLQTLIE